MRGPNLDNHWVVLDEWRGDRELWAFYLTFSQASDLHGYVQRQQAVLQDLAGLDRVEPAWLHLTVQGVAFADSLDEDVVGRLREAGAAVAAAEGPLELVVDPAKVLHDAIALPVRLSEALQRVRNGVRDAAAVLLAGSDLYRLPGSRDVFGPHITIAYARTDAPSVVDVESRLRLLDEPPLRLTATHLSLVRLNRGTSRWWWREELRLPLRQGQEADQGRLGRPGPAVTELRPADAADGTVLAQGRTARRVSRG